MYFITTWRKRKHWMLKRKFQSAISNENKTKQYKKLQITNEWYIADYENERQYIWCFKKNKDYLFADNMA